MPLISRSSHRAAGWVFAALLPAVSFAPLFAQTVSPTRELAQVPLPEPAVNPLPLPEDRGAADLEQTIKRLGTTASVLFIVAHPDDEDGALLAYLTRGLGARATLLTLTRGEGGQNAMSAESYDALGLIRTRELLWADDYYGAKQLWGTEADFGFSKTQEEAFTQWGHERVLYDAVLAVRTVRPQVIVATFVGAASDGHGQHQVSGEIAQEAFKVAGDPKVFPEQLKNGVEPWQPLAVYSRAPFARISNGRMFDYATGKSEPARFKNYVTGEWIEGAPKEDVAIPVGKWDDALGRTYVQIAREGWGKQMSQYGGASPALAGPDMSGYHLWAAVPGATVNAADSANTNLFNNSKVAIDTSLAGLKRLGGERPPSWLGDELSGIDTDLKTFAADADRRDGVAAAHKLAPIYRKTLDLYARIQSSDLSASAKSDLCFELGAKIEQFQSAFKDLLGLDMIAFTTHGTGTAGGGPQRGGSADETPRSVWPGEDLSVRVHLAQASAETRFSRVWLETPGNSIQPKEAEVSIDAAAAARPVFDHVFAAKVSEDAQPTKAFFSRPTTEQPYYDIADQAYRERSYAPYPFSAWAEYSFDGLPVRLGTVVQTLDHVNNIGGVYEPLVITPAIGVRIEPAARILPIDGSPLSMRVTVHAEHAADGIVDLKLPEGWRAQPAQQKFQLGAAGDSVPLLFVVAPPKGKVAATAYSIQATAHSAGKDYDSGWRNVAYPGLKTINQYEAAKFQTREVDVKVAKELRVGYIMGTGDNVPDAIAALGIATHTLTPDEIVSGDLSRWNVIVVGIRAYSAVPQLAAAQPRLNAFVQAGGALIVQYQGGAFPAPLPIDMQGAGDRVVDERNKVALLDASNALLSVPNKITSDDFSGWFEERGHGFPASWNSGYTALTETADPGQDPQRGGLLVTHAGKGTYVYVAFALYRQFPELVPGAYRLFANLLSAGSR